jgi:uncharacterized protein
VKARTLLAALALVVAVWGLRAAAGDFKVPPVPDHYVTDPGGVLSDNTRTSLENELRNYEKSTGHQVIVWIGDTTGDVPLETWTTQTADRWKIGRKGHDDGAVLFLFMKDHKIRIEVGYGLESALPDADAYRIITDEITPRMRAGDPNAAVSAGVAAMLTTITPSYKPSVAPPPQATMPTAATLAIFAVIVLSFLLVVTIVIANVVGSIRYGYLVMREGQKAARRDMTGWWFWSGVGGGSGGGGFSSFGGGGGGFSAGGGSFGGGGASGGW